MKELNLNDILLNTWGSAGLVLLTYLNWDSPELVIFNISLNPDICFQTLIGILLSIPFEFLLIEMLYLIWIKKDFVLKILFWERKISVS